MAFTRPTLPALVQQGWAAMVAQFPAAASAPAAAVLRVLTKTTAGAMHQLYGFLDWVSRQVMPGRQDEEYLARWCALFGVTRAAAAAASGNVTLFGINGSTLPASAQLVRSDGARFVTAADATISSGTATVAVAAAVAGAAGSTAAGVTLSLVVAVPGIQGTATVAAGGIAGGADQQSLAEWQAALESRLQTPPQGGAPADYVAWAKTVPGVTRAWVYPANRGLGTVDLAFVMDGRTNIIPTSGDVTAVRSCL